MGLEIDLLPVGEASAGGDAILVRYGNLDGPRDEQTVIAIDGGYSTTGHQMIDYMATHFDTDRVDIVVSTHPDQDHIAGLLVLLENIDVDLLLMHDPDRIRESVWKGSAFDFGTSTLSHAFTKSLDQSKTLLQLAHRKYVEVCEPFAGMAITPEFTILGPSEDLYDELARQMARTPSRALSHDDVFTKSRKGPTGSAHEDLHAETLSSRGDTSAPNNTSVISMLEVGDHRILFTGDAGEKGLRPVIDELTRLGIAPGGLDIVQVPHHGSRKNVTPLLLDDLLGPITTTSRGLAIASTPKVNTDCTFPAKQTTNAFRRRGYPVMVTAGRPVTGITDPGDGGAVDERAVLPLYGRVETFDD